MRTKRFDIILGIAALLLLLTTAYFGVQYNQEKVAAKTLETEKLELNQDYDVLAADFETLNDEYEALKAENVEMDEELQAKITELEEQKERAERMIRAGGSKEYREAKALIEQLKSEKAELMATIETLKAENEMLKEENEQLAMDLGEEKVKNAVLTEENEHLTVELVEVTDDRDRLVPIANYGQVVQVNDVEAHAVRTKRNGKERKAGVRNAEQLKVCFDMEKNPVAELGEQGYLIRIVSPEGGTIFQEDSGSGLFESLEENSELKYTAEAAVEFNNEEKTVCWYWNQTNEYQKGQYTAEVYHRGYKVGAERFEL